MKRILMRANTPPLAYHTPEEAIRLNLIGNNSGNLLFQYSVLRQIWTEDTQVDFLSEKDMRKGKVKAGSVNEAYDMLVLPFANAFRADMPQVLEKWTAFLKEITIPAVVVGIGLQDSYEVTFRSGFPFDPQVKAFVKEVLRHSVSMGVRGEYTLAYLKQLGFGEDVVEMIGCPSMFLWGDRLPACKETELNRESKVSITGAVGNPQPMKEFLLRVRRDYPNYVFIPQKLADLRLLYAGTSFLEDPNALILYPNTADHVDFVTDRARFFINATSMLSFFAGMDFNIGSRFHGGVAPLLMGVPSLFMPTDARVRELVDYHELPCVHYSEAREDKSLTELAGKANFYAYQKGHKERADRYFRFLERNGIEHVFRDLAKVQVSEDECEGVNECEGTNEQVSADAFCGAACMRTGTPLDRAEALLEQQGKIYPAVRPIAAADPAEIGKRLREMDTSEQMRTIKEKLRWFQKSPAWKIGLSRMRNRYGTGVLKKE
ncbi:MAG: polysaccharide pyruvyl transferase family protein [Lachnospiraceae bacterium]|nr:polysaccharide pyruvyl transferase family protein [Lachnospiraceae bacterium]